MEIVSFEIAKKLKEKGFNEDCYTVYNTATMRIERSLTTWKDYKGVILAPTISQVLKWLREEKNIHIGFGYSLRKKWRYVVMYMDDRFYNNPTLAVDGFLKIEQAALAGIEYVIDNLI